MSRRGTLETETYLGTLNETLLAAINRSGDLFLSNAIIDGRLALRVCVVNFRTSAADIQAVPAAVATLGKQIDVQIRPKELATL